MDGNEKILEKIESAGRWLSALHGLAAEVEALEEAERERERELRRAHIRLDLRRARLREAIGYSDASRKAAEDLGLSSDTPDRTGV